MVNILIVDITRATIYRIKKLLEDYNVNIFEAQTEIEALGRVRDKTNNIDMIVVDVNLGAENGFDLIEKIKRINKDIHIVILTGTNTRQSFVHGIRVGAMDYILKPFDDDYLAERLSKHILSVKRRKSTAVEPDTIPTSIDNALASEIKKALNESYELTVGLIVFSKDPAHYNIQSEYEYMRLSKDYVHYMKKQLDKFDKIIPFSNQGFVVILPKKKLSDKDLIRQTLETQIKMFYSHYRYNNFESIIELINLPDEADEKVNVLTELSRRAVKSAKRQGN
jgi:CheY-like chemotaxis protein